MTCKDRVSFDAQAQFTMRKLIKKGYPKSLLAKSLRYVLDARVERERQQQVRIVPFRMRFFPGAKQLAVTSVVRKHCGNLLPTDARFVACFKSNSNLFRKRFGRFLN